MGSSIGKEIVDLLDDFMGRVSPDVVGALIARRDGLLVVSRVGGGEINAKVISALSAVARHTIDRLGVELNLGDPIMEIAQYTKNTLLFVPLGKDLMLITIARPDANLGLILLEIDELKDKLLKVLVE
nr:MAG: dynein regulation protein LC7 [Vulcanisaeta sp. AZ3]